SGARVAATDGNHCATDFRTDDSPWYDAGEVPLDTPDIATCQVNAVKNVQADVILVDGCINDVGPLDIILNTSLDVGQTVRDKCGQPVYAMLQQLHADHPSAQIIYTGYYRIIDKSLSGVEVLQLAARMNLSEAVAAALRGDLLQARSQTFDDTFRNQANNNVDTLDRAHDWLRFADPHFQAGDGILGSDSKLFGINPFDPDPMFTARVQACIDALGH